MGERLGDGEAPLGRGQLAGEEDARDRVPTLRAVADRLLGGVEPLTVVLDDLAGASGGVVDRLPVARQGESRRELCYPLERGEEVAEGVRPRVGVEPNGRGDPREEVVACDEDSVLQQADVPVRMTGGNGLGSPCRRTGRSARAESRLGCAILLETRGRPQEPVDPSGARTRARGWPSLGSATAHTPHPRESVGPRS